MVADPNENLEVRFLAERRVFIGLNDAMAFSLQCMCYGWVHKDGVHMAYAHIE